MSDSPAPAIDVKTTGPYTCVNIFVLISMRRLTVSLVYRNQRRLSANKRKPHPQGFEQSRSGLSQPNWICISVHKQAKYQVEIISDMQQYQQTSVFSQAERNSNQLKSILMVHDIQQDKLTHFRDSHLYSLGLRSFGTRILKSNVIFILVTLLVDLGIKTPFL